MKYLTRISAICDKHYKEEIPGVVLSSYYVMWPPHLILVSYFKAELAATVISQLKEEEGREMGLKVSWLNSSGLGLNTLSPSDNKT